MRARSRRPAGVPVGGEFAAEVGASTGLSLASGAADLRMVGFNDEQTECDACGRVELRGTVVLADADGVEVARMGTTCAGRRLGRPTARAAALTTENTRRAVVAQELLQAERALAAGTLADALDVLRDTRRRGLHLPEELERAAAIETQVEAIRATKTQRWGVITTPGRPVIELDTVQDAVAAMQRGRDRGAQVVQLRDGQWWDRPADVSDADNDACTDPAPHISLA